jgi:hypothetical protein
MPTVYELESSRAYQYAEGKSKAQRKYIVLDAENEGEVVALFGSSLPDKYDSYPGDGGLPEGLMVRDFSITKVAGRPKTWEIEYEYTIAEHVEFEPSNPHTQDKEPGQVGYRTFSAAVTAVFDDFYRAPYSTTITPDSVQATGTTTDIGGTAIDVAGTPESRIVTQIAYTITVVDRALPSSAVIYQAMGARNSTSFLGWPAGSTVFQGYDATIDPETGNTSCTFRFLVDEFYHMRQRPLRNVDGSVQLGAAGSAYPANAGTVIFRQPFDNFFSFQNLSPFLAGL